MKALCYVEGCRRAGVRKGMCWGHAKRLQRHRPVEGEISEPDPKRTFIEAITHYFSVEGLDEADFEKAWHRVRVAARRYVLADKPTNRYRKTVK